MMRRGQQADPENGSQMPAMMGGVSIFHYAGLVNKQEIHLMKKLMFRASKGKVLCKVCDDQVIDYSFGSEQISLNKKTVEKCIYVLVFGRHAQSMAMRLLARSCSLCKFVW